MTGTPILNRPIELFSVLKSISPQEFGNWKRFVTRYCNGSQTRWGWDVSGSSNMGELQEKLRSTVMVRRLKKDVLTELPAKRRAVIEIPANGASRAVAAEAGAFKSHEQNLEKLRAAMELAKCSDNESYTSAVEALTAGTQAAFAEISKMRHAVALAKVPAVIEFLRDAIEASGKVALFCHHKDVLAKISSEFENVAVLTGDTKLDDRQAAVDKFQTDPDCKLFIGTIGAAGVGITLTASSHVIFAELDWVPGRITQAEDRCHRIGQTNSVLIQHLVLDDSLDVQMAKQLVAKQSVIDAALDDDIPTREPVVPMVPAASANTSRKKLDVIAATLSADDIEKIHIGLKQLRDYCDGARALDGMGFSKIDANIGHSLANTQSLTPRQAALGQKLTNKYRKQLSATVPAP